MCIGILFVRYIKPHIRLNLSDCGAGHTCTSLIDTPHSSPLMDLELSVNMFAKSIVSNPTFIRAVNEKRSKEEVLFD